MDRSGYLHLTYAEQDSRITYRRATAPNSIDGWTERLDLYAPDQAPVTFPSFVFPAGQQPSGPLMIFYRDGPSENQYARIKTYDELTGCWVDGLAPILSGAIENRSAVRIYWAPLVAGTDGSLHLAFVFRGQSPLANGPVDEATLGYARSRDAGLSWYSSSGRPYRLPINPANAEIVHTIKQGHCLQSGPYITLDGDNHPHITFCTDYPNDREEHQHLWFDGSAWHHQFAPPFLTHSSCTPASGTHRSLSLPEILIDPQNTVYIIYDSPVIGGNHNLTTLAAPDYLTSTELVMDNGDVNFPFRIRSIDRTRWNRDIILSLLVTYAAQPNGIEQFSPFTAPLHLIDIQLSTPPLASDPPLLSPTQLALSRMRIE